MGNCCALLKSIMGFATEVDIYCFLFAHDFEMSKPSAW